MRDYAEQVKELRDFAEEFDLEDHTETAIMLAKAADTIEELLVASPPTLWTDEPIEGTEFMTHTQGGRKGFEIHFRTDSREKFMAVQEECRHQIGHAKPEPPKEV